MTKQLIALVLVVGCSLPVQFSETQAKDMNVLLLIVDDLNSWLFDDPDRYPGTVIAPTIQRLADSGLKESQGKPRRA